jgi:hypothetical protein
MIWAEIRIKPSMCPEKLLYSVCRKGRVSPASRGRRKGAARVAHARPEILCKNPEDTLEDLRYGVRLSAQECSLLAETASRGACNLH